MKALWKSQKYENVESKVKAKLQVSTHSALELSGPGMQFSPEALWESGHGGVPEPLDLGQLSDEAWRTDVTVGLCAE